MAISYNEINFNNLIGKVGTCCLTEDVCGTCKKSDCLIGYSKECVSGCLRNKVAYVMDGQERIPLADGKIYEKEDLVDAISDTLIQCKSCKEEHFDNCIINVLRNCYEVLLFGDIKEFKGSTFLYLTQVKENNEALATEIFQRISENV
ncbi:MAG: hypothetical protein RR620_00755 [Clostridium sp.]